MSTLRPLEEIEADLSAWPESDAALERLLADIPPFVAHVRQAARNADELVEMLSAVTAERDELEAQRQRTLEFDIALLEVIGPHIGERGNSEGIVECVRRIIAERGRLQVKNEKLQADASVKSDWLGE